MRRSRSGSGWALVVPVRDPQTGKTRLNSSAALNAAIAEDTVSAALASPAVAHVVLVSDDLSWISSGLMSDFRCEAVLQDAPDEGEELFAGNTFSSTAERVHDAPLQAAVAQGLAHLSRGAGAGAGVALSGAGGSGGAGVGNSGAGGVAVMLGDLPALRPADLTAALRAARLVPRGMVTDHSGEGTTLLTTWNMRQDPHTPQFGPSSARLHAEAGYRALEVSASSSLRRDVDTAADLRAVHELLGSRTRAAAEDLGLLQPALQRAEAA